MAFDMLKTEGHLAANIVDEAGDCFGQSVIGVRSTQLETP